MIIYKKHYIPLIFSLFITCADHPENNSDFRPNWKTGNRWTVITRWKYLKPILGIRKDLLDEYQEIHAGPVEQIEFKVIKPKQMSEMDCYVIEARIKNPTNEYDRNNKWLIYIWKDYFTLNKVEEVTVADNTNIVESSRENRIPNEFCMLNRGIVTFIPFDFPNFPVKNRNEERTAREPGSSDTITQKVTFLNQRTMKIELSTKTRLGIYKTVQIWEEGKPWWSSARKTFTRIDRKTGKEVVEIESTPVLEGVDVTPPQLAVSVEPTELWPPDNKMVKINVQTNVSDDYDYCPEISLDTVFCNESSTYCKGAFITTHDIITQDILINTNCGPLLKDQCGVYLRASRSKKGNGRTYTLMYSAKDASGNRATTHAIVIVPRNKDR